MKITVDVKDLINAQNDGFDIYCDNDELYPNKKQKHFGIELECFGPIDKDNLSYIFALKRIKDCIIKDDCSIRPTNNCESFELNILVTKQNYKSRLKEICTLLKLLKFKVNSSCGLHVHLDMRNRPETEKFKCYNNLVLCQNYLFGLNKSRINNRFCVKVEDKKEKFDRDYKSSYIRYLTNNNLSTKNCSFDEYKKTIRTVRLEETIYDTEHREAINYNTRYDTIEVRIAAPTIDYKKIINWVDLLDKISESKNIKQTNFFMKEGK